MYIQIINKNFQKFIHVCSKNLHHCSIKCTNNILHAKRHNNSIQQLDLVIKIVLWMYCGAILIYQNPNIGLIQKTIMTCPIELKHFQPGVLGMNHVASTYSEVYSHHKIDGCHLSSLTKWPYKHTPMCLASSCPRLPMHWYVSLFRPLPRMKVC